MKRQFQNTKSFISIVEDKKRKERKRLYFLTGIIAVIFLFLITVLFINLYTKRIRYNNSQDSLLPIVCSELANGEIIIPEYDGSPYSVINDNNPFFDLATYDYSLPFESYSELDEYGRCGTAFANLDKSLMPTEEREDIGMIKPSGWHTIKYPDLIDDLYLYNRCHLIAFCLSGENANERNLITGTRYFNVEGMLPFENQVRNVVENTNLHVLYRVTPVFEGYDLVAKGVLMEALSLEDNGEAVSFNVFVYNVQPGIIIDYADGSSRTE